MKKVLNILEYSFCTIGAIAIIIVSVLLGFSELSYQIALYITMGVGFGNLLFLLAKALNKIELKRLDGAIHVSYVVIAVLAHYILSWLGHFEEYMILYWVIYVALLIITIIVMIIVNHKLAPQRAVYKR